MKQYTNELTAEMLASFDQSLFTAEQLAGMNEEIRTLIAERNAYNLAHPVTAAYLVATEGSLTRDGGTVLSEYNGQQIEIEGGVRLNVSLVGNEVRYPDGTTAKIVLKELFKRSKNGAKPMVNRAFVKNELAILSIKC